MDVRIVAILVGFAIPFIIQNGLDARWYVSSCRSCRLRRRPPYRMGDRRAQTSQPGEAERPIREITERLSGVKQTSRFDRAPAAYDS